VRISRGLVVARCKAVCGRDGSTRHFGRGRHKNLSGAISWLTFFAGAAADAARRQLLRDQIGMAINSAGSRSQGQLHIHVSCIAPVVADFLRRHQAEIHGAWSPLRAKLAGHKFTAMKVETESLAPVDPFKLLVRGLPSGRISMRTQTLAVFGATFRNGKSGFYLLANDLVRRRVIP
jgi:CDP-diacylglycerol pyrophosphatase